MANALVVVGLLRGCWFAFACEARFVFALACVAEGFVERAVGAEVWVCEYARDDEFGLVCDGVVGCVALCDGLRALVVEVFDVLARGARARDERLVLRQRHPAESLVGRERPPGVQHPLHPLFNKFWTPWHVS